MIILNNHDIESLSHYNEKTDGGDRWNNGSEEKQKQKQIEKQAA